MNIIKLIDWYDYNIFMGIYFYNMNGIYVYVIYLLYLSLYV